MIVLDIFIGLVLVYFLYSLLVSLIGEHIATWLGMRARILRQGIDNLLNDKKSGVSKRDFKKWIRDVFLIEHLDFKYTNAGKFYKEPTIKYLAKVGEHKRYSIRNTKPAYIDKGQFINTVLNMLTRKSIGVNEWEKVKFSIENNILMMEPDAQKMFADWLKRSNDDYLMFKKHMGDSFDQMMDRINGWYKRKISMILFYIGLLLCFALNVDTFEIVDILKNNPDTRKEMLGMAISTVEVYNKYMIKDSTKSDAAKGDISQDSLIQDSLLMDTYNQTLKSVDEMSNVLGSGWVYPLDTTTKKFRIDKRRINELNGLLTRYHSTNGKPNNDQSIYLDSINLLLHSSAITLDTNLSTFNIDDKSYQSKCHNICINLKGVFEKNRGEKFLFILSKSHPLKKKFWGFIVTALALSLGAKFWFDLLKKLVALRGAGVKPEEKKSKPGEKEDQANNGLALSTTDPVSIGILQKRAYWESIPGFVAVNESFDTNNQKLIQLTFEKGKKPSNIGNEIKVDVNGESYKVEIEYIEGSKGSFNEPANFGINSIPENAIIQKHRNSWGTIAGKLFDPRSGKNVLLTCGHVTRSGASSFIDNNISDMTMMSGGVKIPIGKAINQVLSSFCDAGIVSYQKNKMELAQITKIDSLRKLTYKDNFNTQVKINVLGSEAKNGIIVKIDNYYSFDDDLTTGFNFFDLIVMGNKNGDFSKTLTNPGDSGSLITDKSGQAIGILVGAAQSNNQYFSFGIKMKDILDILQLEFYNHDI